MKRSPCYQGSRTKDTNLFDLFPCLKIKTESGLNAQIAATHKEIELKDNTKRNEPHSVPFLKSFSCDTPRCRCLVLNRILTLVYQLTSQCCLSKRLYSVEICNIYANIFNNIIKNLVIYSTVPNLRNFPYLMSPIWIVIKYTLKFEYICLSLRSRLKKKYHG